MSSLPWRSPLSPVPGYTPFNVADEIELRMHNGSNHPWIQSRLENAIHGVDGDHSKRSDAPWPWPAVMAHADLVREAMRSEALCFLGWTWFPENLPREWPHGALRNGQLQPHARARRPVNQFTRPAPAAFD